MAAQIPLSPEPEQQPNWHDPQRHGNLSQIGTVIIAIGALLVAGGSLVFNVRSRNSDKNAQVSDEHTNTLIQAKLDPATSAVNGHIDGKTSELSQRIDKLSDKVGELSGKISNMQGLMGKQISQLEKRVDQHEVLARIQEDPEKILGIIRDEIRLAQQTKQEIPYPKLVDYKLAIHALAPSVVDYWKTAAEIINYQSFIDQLGGQAPDPKMVSGMCFGVTNQGTIMSDNNLYVGAVFSRCIVDLDTNVFRDVVFENSVVRYRGGRVSLVNVRFVNCHFVLDFPSSISPERTLLFALLDAPSQSRVMVSTH